MIKVKRARFSFVPPDFDEIRRCHAVSHHFHQITGLIKFLARHQIDLIHQIEEKTRCSLACHALTRQRHKSKLVPFDSLS